MTEKVAIVTGASLGIGFATTQSLLKEGYRVVICARNKENLDIALDKLQSSAGKNVAATVCDVRDYEQVKALFEFTDKTFGGLDLLVNNAGVGIFKNVEDMSVEEWRTVIETNVNSLFYCSNLAIARMRARGGGYIFNIGSLAGKNAFPKAAAYNASKFALIGFSEALMQEVRYDNIKVSYIMPGSVTTYFASHTPNDEDEWKLTAEDIAQVIIDLLHHHPRSLPSRVEIRPSKPARK
ncbi:MAG: SDR family oxidoreductase [Blastocatellia bacterium]|nr:SDR family oxidoreductase [Blastocatellia bacterium]